jgi:hypothetical protein
MQSLTIPALQAQSKQKIDKSCFGNGFVKPAYDDYCFANLPGFFESVLTGGTTRPNLPADVLKVCGSFDHLIFVFFDSFGWQSFERHIDSSVFLKTINNEGIILRTTAQFPSTTATHVTTVFSGLTAFEHYICGWDYYEPVVGRMIKPLPLSFSEDAVAGTVLKAGFKPEDILPRGKFISSLLQAGISVKMHGPSNIYPSPYTDRYLAREDIRGFRTLEQGVSNLQESIAQSNNKSYSMVYIDSYDKSCHLTGIDSKEADETASYILNQLQALLTRKFPRNTLLVLSADHGQISDKPNGGIALNTVIPHLERYLKTDVTGRPIRYSGGRHHMFLHCKESLVNELSYHLQTKLKGIATIMLQSDLIENNLLGPKEVPADFLIRLGNIGILPHRGHSIYWLEPPNFLDDEPSGHGGLTREEMETPLLLFPLR